MAISDALALDSNSIRAKRLEDVNPNDFKWAIPFMRAGYAGRALVYVVVAGFSLWSIAQGGQAEGTKSVMESLTGSGWPILVLIAVGMAAYAIWRLIDSLADLEAYGTDGKGLIARAGMLVTGVIHLGIGLLALGTLIGSSSGGGTGGIVATVMQLEGGRWIIGAAGALTLCASAYYFDKGIKGKYRAHLVANRFTTRWNTILKAGVIAQGVVVGIIGILILYAALQADASQSVGLDAAFEWLRSQAFGRILVIVLCVGLVAFAIFCAVNAVYRIVPKAYDGSGETLAAHLKRATS
ncbi:hypothetical protein roselon_00539 [Roseibacterium elongatum DSM 19469]|uniref:DUF1206 domain-containing protein n=1 Tax=Roseicyclus elongatus DSM 19469 TaxID=1294273 RepID=W8RPB4_9RHOB|nr:DUF1206 domain-containing protein [Roseibacterium elongatum]AHM02979.1 hypothetical protein roselon_00539 [Roseibacterium elongatum DSM 19469]